MLGALIPCGGGEPVPLQKPKMLVGRHKNCDFPLGFMTVSARHCELEMIDGFWCVRDLGSRNGILVNGVQCDFQRLMPNDILSIAGYRFTIEYSPAGSEPSAQRSFDRFGGSLLEKAGLTRPAPVPPRRLPKSGPTGDSLLGELVPCGGGNPIPLLKPKLLVGRDDSCDIALKFRTVSSRHCELEFKEGYWSVCDLGSSNGTRVDGVLCDSKRVMPNNVLSFAQFRFRINYTPRDEALQSQKVQPAARGFLQRVGFGPRKPPEAGRLTPRPEPADPLAGLPRDEEEPLRKRWSLDDNET